MPSATRRTTPAIIAVLIAIGSSETATAGPGRVPNKQPYRVTATATATGRTGSATMSARALIDRNHRGALEIVAGDFEGPPVGTLAKFQVKTFDGNGDLLYSNNYSGFSVPSMAVPVDGLERGQALDVQGNIRNVDNTRTDVVSVTTVGRLRPDLAVLRVSAPAGARAGFPVHISAAVAELNHDTGARASCVLFVDDAQVDQAEGIWVDAGDTVSCAFIHVFSMGGQHQFRVDVTQVNPGDWDAANNSGGGSVTIFTDEQSFNAVSAWISESHEHYRIHNTGYTRRNEGGADYVRTFDFLTDQSRNTQGALYAAYVTAPVTFPLTQVAVAQWTDDILIHQGVYNGVAATSVSPYVTCAHVVDDADVAVYIDVCVRPGPSGPMTLIGYSRYVGTVAYFSNRYDAAWYETPEGVVPIYTYSYNYHESSSTGSLGVLGETYRFEVTLINGGTVYSKPVSFAIGALQTGTDVNYPWACQEFSDPLYGYKKICDEFINFSAGRFMSVDWP
jgi:hypothetical protein